MFFPFGKAGGLQMRRYQGFEVDDYVFTLDAPLRRILRLASLKPSRFCNVGVYV